MCKNKILVICPLHEAVLQKYAEQVDYRPHLSKTSSFEWQKSIQQTKATIIIINTEYFTREMMQIWRNYLPTESLTIVRAGTSLSKCDLEAAHLYSIHVFNTPGVNSKYVADYMNQILFEKPLSIDRIAIIGVGNIGSRIALAAVDHQIDFVLYNKNKGSNHLQILGEKLVFSHNLETAITPVNKIAISLPLDASTHGIITAKIIDKIQQNAILVCVSPLEIFTGEALMALYHRNDIRVFFDDINSELQRVYQMMGSPNPLRDNFIMDTRAAASAECQNAMTSAAIEKSLVAIKQPASSFYVCSPPFKIRNKSPKISSRSLAIRRDL